MEYPIKNESETQVDLNNKIAKDNDNFISNNEHPIKNESGTQVDLNNKITKDNDNFISNNDDCIEKNVSNEKRKNYLSWDDFFIATAFLAAKRSKDPVTQVGACIVSPDKKIVGTGYNGMPTGCNDDEFPWGKNNPSKLENKYLYVCHAEMNAVLNRNSSDIRNCTMYVALFPCNECAKVIIQSGIKEVVYLSDKYSYKAKVIASKRMLNAAGITFRKHTPSTDRLVLDFSDIN